MESNYHEECINSSEEVIDHSSDQEKSDLGVGRSYECVFCKRGFNTAQALGGHMNIHRKDRARNKPNSHKQDEIYTAPRLYHQIPSSCYGSSNHSANHRLSSQDHQPILSYATYFPPSTSSSRPMSGSNYQHQNDSGRDHPQPSDPLTHGDWRVSLSLEFPPRIMEDMEEKRRAMDQDKDLDLELRLGYDS